MKTPRGRDDEASATAAIVTIDIAHPPVSSADAERVLDDALRAASLSGCTRIIRIIHGYGSGGKGGVLKTTVRNWAFMRKARVAMVVAGEEYSPFDPKVQQFLQEAELSLAGLGPADPGYTLIFIP